MKKAWKSLASAMLAVAMVLTAVMTYLPSLEILAAPIMKNMAHLQSGSGNANGHFGSSTPEAFVLSDNADITDEDFSFTLKVGSTQNDTRFRFVNKYVDDSNWSFIAYDGMSSNWFVPGISLLYRFPFYKYSPALFSLTNSLSPCLVIFWDRKYPI